MMPLALGTCLLFFVGVPLAVVVVAWLVGKAAGR